MRLQNARGKSAQRIVWREYRAHWQQLKNLNTPLFPSLRSWKFRDQKPDKRDRCAFGPHYQMIENVRTGSQHEIGDIY